MLQFLFCMQKLNLKVTVLSFMFWIFILLIFQKLKAWWLHKKLEAFEVGELPCSSLTNWGWKNTYCEKWCSYRLSVFEQSELSIRSTKVLYIEYRSNELYTLVKTQFSPLDKFILNVISVNALLILQLFNQASKLTKVFIISL